uniref:DUF834 domain-containing protein n=1 Tax=Oryza glumipatula TaxID=40148 RepID=A0A0E0ARG5_9ORYZ
MAEARLDPGDKPTQGNQGDVSATASTKQHHDDNDGEFGVLWRKAERLGPSLLRRWRATPRCASSGPSPTSTLLDGDGGRARVDGIVEEIHVSI